MINRNLFLMSMLSLTACGSNPERETTPNIIVILADDMGYSDIGCYGGVISTPHLDSLANNGLRYTQFYNTARSCPSRASLLTGLHPHQAGVGWMTDDLGYDGYRGDLSSHSLTIAEVLRSAGYSTYMSGKWHVTRNIAPNGCKDNWPMQRGFDKFYGTIIGAGSFYDPFTLARGNNYITPDNDSLYNPDNFYYTNAITDNALMFLDEHNKNKDLKDKPFFVYLSYTTAHWPMQAPEEDIEPYKGKFDVGWDSLRNLKMSLAASKGVIDGKWTLSSDSTVTRWDSLDNKAFESRCMEVYAGMVTNMDNNIGKVVNYLKTQGKLENTIIIYLQDNGGCEETWGRWSPSPSYVNPPKGVDKIEPMKADELQNMMMPYRTRDGRNVRTGIGVMPGSDDTFVSCGKGWAHLSNTPFREYKHWVHEGGIATPLIVYYPKGIKEKGGIRHQPGQLPDIMATCVDLSNACYPLNAKGDTIIPMEGISLKKSFKKDNPNSVRPLFWEHEGNRAIRIGKWKLVCKLPPRHKREVPDELWELYDMDSDRTETNNLANKYPQRVTDMIRQWNEFAVRCQVKPWPVD